MVLFKVIEFLIKRLRKRMLKKSVSVNSLFNLNNFNNDSKIDNNALNNKRMIRAKSYDNIHDALLNDEKIKNTYWDNVENVSTILSYTPINAALKCISERTFPISLVSKPDNTYVELGVCLSNPENYVKEESNNEELFYDIRRQMSSGSRERRSKRGFI